MPQEAQQDVSTSFSSLILYRRYNNLISSQSSFALQDYEYVSAVLLSSSLDGHHHDQNNVLQRTHLKKDSEQFFGFWILDVEWFVSSPTQPTNTTTKCKKVSVIIVEKGSRQK